MRSFEREQLGTGAGVPHPRYVRVRLGSDDPRSVRAERCRTNRPWERKDFGSSPRVADLRRHGIGDDDPRPVSAERHPIDVVGVPLSVSSSTPVWASHTLANLSQLPAVTTRDPSGLNDTVTVGLIVAF